MVRIWIIYLLTCYCKFNDFISYTLVYIIKERTFVTGLLICHTKLILNNILLKKK